MTVRTPIDRRLLLAFGCLAAAWLCANVRPGTVGAVFDWCTSGARFSHQQRLTLQVAELLGGERLAEPQPLAVAAQSESAPKPAPPVPALSEPAFRKLETPLARAVAIAPAPARRFAYSLCDDTNAGRDRAAPPHGPPRTATLS